MTTEHLYIRADELRRGDMLPTKSRWPVLSVTVQPNVNVTILHAGGYTWHAPHGGPDFGFGCYHVERPISRN